MNQIRHILDAGLIVLMGIMAHFLYQNFSSSGLIGENTEETKGPVLTGREQHPGQQVFVQYCGGCHHLQRELIGPSLGGVRQRGPWQDAESLKNWIRDPEGFSKTSDYARALMDRYTASMPAFAHLSEAQIGQIVGYLTEE